MSNSLQQGIVALKAGDTSTACQLLVQAVQENPRDEKAWLWLSAALEDEEKRAACLERVLAINPDNEPAQRGLAALRREQARSTPTASTSASVARSSAAPIGHSQEFAETQEFTSAAPAAPSSPGQVQALSPWLSIWTRPRETIRYIVDSDPTGYVVILAMIAGLGQALDGLSGRDAGDYLSPAILLVLAVILGPIGGIISLYFDGFFLRWVGSWFGGQASSEQVRAAVAWSSVPRIFALLLWIPELALLGEEMFKSTTFRIESSLVVALFFFGCVGLEVILGIWSFVLRLQCLGEVHGFSAWKALASLLVVRIVSIAPFLCLGLGLLVFLATGQ